MVTIEFTSFQKLKDTFAIADVSPDRFKPYKFHTLDNNNKNNVKRIVCILSSGRITLLYNAKSNENITTQTDNNNWFVDSIEVLNVGENIA